MGTFFDVREILEFAVFIEQMVSVYSGAVRNSPILRLSTSHLSAGEETSTRSSSRRWPRVREISYQGDLHRRVPGVI